MSLTKKVLIIIAIPALLVFWVGLRSTLLAEKMLRQSIEDRSALEVRGLLNEIDRFLIHQSANWQAYAKGSLIQESLIASNQEYKDIEDLDDWLETVDQEWRKGESPEVRLMQRNLLKNRLSRDFRARQKRLEHIFGYPIFGEVFVTNSYGANVAQTNLTTDFQQSDETWWNLAVENEIHIGQIKYDESADSFAIDICIRIDDHEGSFIGVLKALLNIKGVVKLVDFHAMHLREGATIALINQKDTIIRMGKSGDPENLDQEKPEFSPCVNLAGSVKQMNANLEKSNPVTVPFFNRTKRKNISTLWRKAAMAHQSASWVGSLSKLRRQITFWHRYRNYVIGFTTSPLAQHFCP